MTDSSNNKQPDYARLMAQALEKIERLEARLKDNQPTSTPIAIVGMGCRFPGSANSLNGYLDLLRNAKDAISAIPSWRWDVDKFYDSDADKEGKSYVKEGGFVDTIREFDAAFFDISPREAMGMDPQQRLWLEVCWEALENAHILPSDLYAGQSGVFVGASSFDFAAVMAKNLAREEIDAYLGTGASLNILAGRVSYLLGLTGPSMAVDTACSSSLVAVHNACQSLRQKECDLALAGGVNVLLSPETYIAFSRGQMLSPSARCKTFADDADGFIRSEGCGAVVLKRLDDALAAGDRIYALVDGSAVNQDGPCGGLTVPSGPAQQAVIRRALQVAQIKPEQIDYIEAHGTATPLGDPIEMGALAATYGEQRQTPAYVGAIKSNLGHMEAAAGIAGLIKTALSLYYGEIYANLHFTSPSQHIDWKTWPVMIAQQRQAWPSSQSKRFAAVSSFGLSGTNAHMIMSSQPTDETQTREAAHPASLQLILLSAKDKQALGAASKQAAEHLADPDVNYADLCYSYNRFRSLFSHRLALISQSETDLQQQLEDAVIQIEQSDSLPESVFIAAQETQQAPKIAFMFTGQGAQWTAMAKQWYGHLDEFTRQLDGCHEILQSDTKFNLKAVLGLNDSVDNGIDINATAIAQPALFAFEYALAKQWIAWGIKPQALLGHSLGEYVAACIAGVFNLRQGLQLVQQRADLMQSLPGTGMMVAFALAAEDLKPILARFSSLSIAAYNASQACVVSGPEAGMRKFLIACQEQAIEGIPLATSHAFHSQCVEPMMSDFHQLLEELPLQSPKIPLISNLTGRLETECFRDSGYWVQHLRQAVRFQQGLASLSQTGIEIVIEIGPKASLCGLLKQELIARQGSSMLAIPSCKLNAADNTLQQALLELAKRGAEFDWQVLNRGRRIDLPSYAWNRQNYWPEWFNNDQHRFDQGHKVADSLLEHPWAGKQLSSPAFTSGQVVFEKILNLDIDEWLRQHQVYTLCVAPMALFVSMACQALRQIEPERLVQLNDIRVERALVLETGKPLSLQMLINRSEQSFIVLSQVQGEQKWHEHFSGSYGFSANDMVPANYQEFLPSGQVRRDLTALQSACNVEMSRDHYYQLFARQGIGYGPAFKTIERIWRAGRQALLELSEERQRLLSDDSRSIPHPILLDTLLQSLGAVLAETDTSLSQSGLNLPIGMSQIKFNPRLFLAQSDSANRMTGKQYISVQNDPDTATTEIELLAEDGEILLSCQGVETQPISEARLKQLLMPKQNRMYQLQWQEYQNVALVNPVTLEHQHKKWLIIDPAQVCLELSEQLSAQGQQVTRLTEAVLSADLLHQIKLVEMDEIIDARACLGGELSEEHKPNQSLELAELMRPCNELLLAIQLFAEAFSKVSTPSPRLTVLVEENFAGAAVQGFMRVLGQEYPEWRARLIIAQVSPALLPVLVTDSQEQSLCYRQNAWFKQRLIASTHVPNASQQRLDPAASYLITGGLGALGVISTLCLARKGAKHLLLSTRHADALLPVELLELQQTQSDIELEIVTLDLTDRAALTKWQQDLNQQHRTLRGVIHCAGYSDDDLIINQTPERFNQVAAPKLSAALNLDHLSRYAEMQFFILFSSFNALVGSLGQSAYAAANAAMDRVAEERQYAGYNALSINWGPWKMGLKAESEGNSELYLESVESIAKSRTDYRAYWQQAGIQAIDATTGSAILEQLLDAHQVAETTPNLAVIDADWQRLGEHLAGQQAPSLLADLLAENEKSLVTGSYSSSALENILAAPATQQSTLVSDYFMQRLAKTLRLDLAQINPHSGLSALGLDSLAAVELRSLIRKELQCDIVVSKLLQGDVAAIIQSLELSLLTKQDKNTNTELGVTSEEFGPSLNNEDDFVVGEL